jgi:DNA-binding NarL/FixJ family response regulator
MDNTIIRLAIIDDHQIVIDGLIAALKTYPSLDVVVTANKAEDMLAALYHTPVDVLLTDVMMPGVSGQVLAKEVRTRFPHIRIIALSMSGNGTVVDEMINDADIAGYMLKQSTVSELAQAIEKVYKGGIYFQEHILSELCKISNRRKEVEETRLTPREKQIIALIEKDYSTKQIAEHLDIAVRTVETHRKSICKKTGTNTSLALVKWAYDHQLL